SGWSVQWKSPPRDAAEISWTDAIRYHGLHTLLGLVWAAVVYWLNPAFLWWLLPVVGALIVSIPISVYSSRVTLGCRLREARFFVTPEESRPPQELVSTRDALKGAAHVPGFVEAVVDPMTNALACASASGRLARADFAGDKGTQLLHQALTKGPDALTVPQKASLLRDPIGLSQLHFQVWTSPDAHQGWLQTHQPRRQREGEAPTTGQYGGYGGPPLTGQLPHQA